MNRTIICQSCVKSLAPAAEIHIMGKCRRDCHRIFPEGSNAK